MSWWLVVAVLVVNRGLALAQEVGALVVFFPQRPSISEWGHRP